MISKRVMNMLDVMNRHKSGEKPPQKEVWSNKPVTIRSPITTHALKAWT